jgi:leucyl-tRNA synthetase
LRFNVAVANIHEFSNILQPALSLSGSDVAWAIREAGAFLALMIGPMMPHLAEECWARLGYNTLLANEPWPAIEPDLLVDDQVTIAVQVNGKRRDELVISRTARSDEVEAAALRLGSVLRALDGRQPKKVIVVPQRIVNVVG